MANNLYASRDGDPSLSPLWANIVGKPSTFTPSAHVHAWGDITSGVPLTFNPTVHGDGSHTESYLRATGTPVNNQIGIWVDDVTMEGDANLTWDGTKLVIKETATPQIDLYTGAYKRADIRATTASLLLNSITGNDIQLQTDSTTKVTVSSAGNLSCVGEITAYA